MRTREKKYKPMTGEELAHYRHQIKETQDVTSARFGYSLKGWQKFEQNERKVPDHLSRAVKMEKRLRKLEGKDGKPI